MLLAGKHAVISGVGPGLGRRARSRRFAGRARDRRDHRAPGDISSPDEIAGSVLFLASHLARPVIGHVLDCNAGMWM